jgi:hypothetical protein
VRSKLKKGRTLLTKRTCANNLLDVGMIVQDYAGAIRDPLAQLWQYVAVAWSRPPWLHQKYEQKDANETCTSNPNHNIIHPAPDNLAIVNCDRSQMPWEKTACFQEDTCHATIVESLFVDARMTPKSRRHLPVRGIGRMQHLDGMQRRDESSDVPRHYDGATGSAIFVLSQVVGRPLVFSLSLRPVLAFVVEVAVLANLSQYHWKQLGHSPWIAASVSFCFSVA